MSAVRMNEAEEARATRIAIVVDDSLPPGLAANAAAMLALTLGATMPALLGDPLVDANGEVHAGFMPQGLPILRAPRSELGQLRARAIAAGIEVVDFPTYCQQTADYGEVIERVASTSTTELEYAGIAMRGTSRQVRKVSGSLSLLR